MVSLLQARVLRVEFQSRNPEECKINNDEIEQADGVEVYCPIHTLTMMEPFL